MDNWIFTTIIIVLTIIFVLTLFSTSTPSVENLSGFGVTSALNAYDRAYYTDNPPYYPGQAYSGGSFLIGKVII